MRRVTAVPRRVLCGFVPAVLYLALQGLPATSASAANAACPTASGSTATACTFTVSEEALAAGTSNVWVERGAVGGGAGLSYIEAIASDTSVAPTTAPASVTISWRVPTTTSVSCHPDPVSAGHTTMCTATVADFTSSGAGAPSGTVNFSSSGHGELLSKSCTLSGSPDATCSVTFRATTAGASTITATYGGAGAHEGSTGKTTVTVEAVRPRVTTKKATGVKTRSARLHGSVVPGGAKTTYYFQYGTSRAYGSRTPRHTLRAGDSARSVSALIRGLRPGRTYHFRLVARNSAGTAHGRDLTFRTAALAPAPSRGRGTPVFTG